MRISKSVMGLAAVTISLATPVFAHHSFSMFDGEKSVTLEGTVKEFQWTNPHSWVQLLVPDPNTGKNVEWSIEGGAVNLLARQGWSRNSLKPGDKATIVVHPLKDGTPGGQLVSAAINGVEINRRQQ